MKDIVLAVTVAVGLTVLIIGIILGFDWFVWMVYNTTMPGWLHWPRAGYWQIVGVMCLLGIVGGFVRSSVEVKDK